LLTNTGRGGEEDQLAEVAADTAAALPGSNSMTIAEIKKFKPLHGARIWTGCFALEDALLFYVCWCNETSACVIQ
jgi:hypothetical protein